MPDNTVKPWNIKRECGNCRFYREKECHFDPPVVIGTPVVPVTIKSVWPPVAASAWCGKWVQL